MKGVFLTIALIGLISVADAQTSEFTYQGNLSVGPGPALAPADGNYDFEFRLFQDETGGSAIGTVQRLNVPVSNGSFSVKLDFGAQFNVALRHLEIGVRPAGGGSFQTLAPRQLITSAPYAIRSISAFSADRLNNVAANQYVLTTDSRMTDARSPLPNSSNYIQNQNASGQAANFNVNGDGIIGGNLTLNAALLNGGNLNVAGQVRVGPNGFFVDSFGPTVPGGYFTVKPFFSGNGGYVGIGTNDPLYRLHVVGNASGLGLRVEENSQFSVGTVASFGPTGLFQVDAPNVVGGRFTILENGNIGLGTATPGFRLDAVGRIRIKQNAGDFNSTNTAGIWLFQNIPGDRAFVGMESDNTVGFYGQNGGIWGLVMNTQNGFVSLRSLSAAGGIGLCRNTFNEISNCSSSLRYKTDIGSFVPGLAFVNQLRPISFRWKEGGMKDVGFGAEDVEKIDTRLVTYNDKGEVEGVKYDRLSAIFVNAFKEQQAQIERLEKANARQEEQITLLMRLVCSHRSRAKACKGASK